MQSRLLVLLAVTLVLAGCSLPYRRACNANSLVLYTRVAITRSVVPPHTVERQFVVEARGFSPNAQARLGVIHFPERDSISEVVTLDSAGELRWTTGAPTVLSTHPEYDPDSDVRTTLVEVNSTCSATTSIKQREFSRL